ncbi:MAG TPA: hypothetical protein VNZ22_20740 [Bacillota bacterium]|nr:hypothetical protein [Bacillota bacterium]
MRMETDSIVFQTWSRNIRAAGIVAACALGSCVLSLWLTLPLKAVVLGAFICGIVAFFLSALQVRTKRYFGFIHTMFSVFSMLIISKELAPPVHQLTAVWQFVSVYTAVWFGLLFLFRRVLMQRLEATHGA